MFIFWGRKLVYRSLGYVADFCPICRASRSFELKRLGSAGHVYYISFGEGELVGFERTCQECRTTYQAEPTGYASLSKSLIPLPELIRQTYPNLDQVLAGRLALEEKVRRNPMSLTREERSGLIRSPFLLLSPKVEKRFASTHIDMGVGLSLLGAIGLLMIGPAIMHAVLPDSEGLSILLFIAVGIALVVWQVIASGKRFMRREVIPVLASSLQPLSPSEPEIASVLAELKQLRHKIASKLSIAELAARMPMRGQIEPKLTAADGSL